MPQEFTAGEIVVLKSGSPKMTVKQLIDGGPYEGQYTCQWFSGKKLEQGQFTPDSIRLATADDK